MVDLVSFDWVYKEFIPTVQQRGAQIIAARGKSSAQSAANAAISHMRDWVAGSASWQSMGVKGSGQYGIPTNIWCSFPIYNRPGEWQIIEGVEVDQEGAKRINASVRELLEERQAVESLLPPKVFRGVGYSSDIFGWRHLFDSASEHVQPLLVGDFEFQDALKGYLAKHMGLGGSEPWSLVTKESVDKVQVGWTQFETYTSKYSKQDLDKILKMVKNLVFLDFSLVTRKVQKVKWDLQDFEQYGNDNYKGMTREAKLTHHIGFLLRDSKLKTSGINTLKYVSDYLHANLK